MQTISLIAHKITTDYPYNFVEEIDFRWSPNTETIYSPPISSIEDIWSLLHEVAHAELKHNAYKGDIQLVKHEAAAWGHAITVIAPKYGLIIDQNYVEDHLDTYRLWLHQRSTCPECGQNGLQTKNTYSCLNCRCVWRANEARLCALRRIKLQDQSLT